MYSASKKNGFTIVELLIVIVVIAILAAISIIAYNGIRNRADNTSVQSDLSQVRKLMEVYKIDKGSYPTATDAELAKVSMKISLPSYDTTINQENFYYCLNSDSGDFAVVVRSKSGSTYYIDSVSSGVKNYAGLWGSNNICGVVGMVNYSRISGRTTTYEWKYWLQ